MEDGLTPLVRMFEESEDATRDARKLCERDIDYYDGKQWTAAQTKVLERRKQPVVTYNRIQRKIDYLSGLEKQQRKDPKAFPRNPEDEAAANAATDAIRYVCDDCDWDDKRSAAWDDILTPGTGAIMVGHKETKDGIDPDLIHIPWDRFWYDPYSSRPDFSDARSMGIVTWYDFDEALRRWPDKEEVLQATIDSDRNAETYDDKPKHSLWADAKRRRLRVVEGYYKKKGAWHRCVATKGGELEAVAPSPYIDEEGQPENPIKAASLYVDRDNNRYGATRVMISAQDEINQRKSKGLHRSAMRQARVSPSAIEDKETIRRELAKPDGLITAEKDDFEILNGADLLQAEFEMYLDAKAEIDLLGANAALAGKNENDMSGRAILAQQQGGMVEVARMFDRLRSLSIDVYRSIWNRIRQFWSDERWVRVTDDDNNLRFVGLNQKITVAMLAQEVMQGDEDATQKAAQLVGPKVLQAAMQQAPDGDPQAQQIQQQAQAAIGMFVQQHGHEVVETRNAVNELDVDIVVDEGMDTPTIQSEQFDTLTKMLPALTSLPPEYAKLVVQASAFRDKDKLLEILDGMSQQGNPAEAQMQAETKAEEAKLQLTAKIKAAELEQNAQLKREEMQSDAEIAREKMMLDAKIKMDGARMVAENDAAIESEKVRIAATVEDEKNRIEAERQAKLDDRDHEAKAHRENETAKSDAAQQALTLIAEHLAKASKPKRRIPIRDKSGLIIELREADD